jgi:hypothetical protein
MTVLALVLIGLAPITGSLGLVFTDNYPAKVVIGNIYAGELAYSPWSINRVYVGITANFAYKQASPFADDYLENPGLHMTFGSIGVGPHIASQLSDIFGIGFNMIFNCQMISYPASGPNSTVISQSEIMGRFGTSLYGTFTPIAAGKLRFGIQFGLYLNGTGNNSYQYAASNRPFEHYGIYGFTLKVRIERLP